MGKHGAMERYLDEYRKHLAKEGRVAVNEKREPCQQGVGTPHQQEEKRRESLVKSITLPSWPVPMTPAIMKMMREQKEQMKQAINMPLPLIRGDQNKGDDVDKEASIYQQQEIANSSSGQTRDTSSSIAHHNPCVVPPSRSQQQEQISSHAPILSRASAPLPNSMAAADESQSIVDELGEMPPLIHIDSQEKEEGDTPGWSQSDTDLHS